MLTYPILLPSEHKRCPLTLASVLACADSTDELRFRGMCGSYTARPPTRFLGKENWRYIDQISPRLLPWSLEFILNSELRIKYAEIVHYWFKQIPFFALIRNSLPNSIASQIHRGESQRYPQIIRLHQRYPLVEEFPRSEWVYLFDQF